VKWQNSQRPSLFVLTFLLGLAVVFFPYAGFTKQNPRIPLSDGNQLYLQHCASCHGPKGLGDGQALLGLNVRPRAFQKEPFRYISTDNGIPSQKDLFQSIRYGRTGGEMPAFPYLNDQEVLQLVNYVRNLNKQGELKRLKVELKDEKMSSEEIEEIALERVTPGESIRVFFPGPSFPWNTAIGKKLFLENCATCHGKRGDGNGSQKLKDSRGKNIKARDFSSGHFRGGTASEEIFKRIRFGIPGTPMPAQDALSNEEIWQIVHYVKVLSGNP